MSVAENLHSAELAADALSAMGINVIGIVVNTRKSVIRIEHCYQCDSLIKEGRARYLYWGGGSVERHTQGCFDINNVRIIWSETIQ